ncbi:MAG: multidrug transporter MurJ, partial [Bdellovibrionaceae bacterium]|nr:multidrug transporter MurJ [Pseudobdellovibrionaceae bacterium]
MQQKSRLAVQAFLMSLGTLASRVLGLVRESLFAAWFDREITDAWYIAFRLPNLFRRLFGEGALSVSFIPLFIESQKKNEAEGFFNSFFWVFTIFLLGFAILGIVLMPAFLPWFLDADYVAK